MYDVWYGVPPSMLTMTDCGKVGLGVLPLKAIDVPVNPSLALPKLFKSDRKMRHTLKRQLE
jgi:hypothetical protein